MKDALSVVVMVVVRVASSVDWKVEKMDASLVDYWVENWDALLVVETVVVKVVLSADSMVVAMVVAMVGWKVDLMVWLVHMKVAYLVVDWVVVMAVRSVLWVNTMAALMAETTVESSVACLAERMVVYLVVVRVASSVDLKVDWTDASLVVDLVVSWDASKAEYLAAT